MRLFANGRIGITYNIPQSTAQVQRIFEKKKAKSEDFTFNVLSHHRRVAIDIKFLLAGHPFLFFGWEGGVELGDGGFIIATIGGGGGDVHPLFAVKYVRHKFADEECRWIVTVHNKAYVLFLATHKSAAYVVSGVAKVDVHVVAHLSCDFKGMFNEKLAESLSLIFGCDAKRSEGKDLLALSVLVLKPSLCIHNVSDDLAVKLKYECKLGDKVWVITHHVNVIMLTRAGDVNIPKRLACKFLNCSIIFFSF